jgi:hypothetical protein
LIVIETLSDWFGLRAASESEESPLAPACGGEGGRGPGEGGRGPRYALGNGSNEGMEIYHDLAPLIGS